MYFTVIEKIDGEDIIYILGDLRCRLRSRDMVPLQGSREWLASHMYCLLFHCFHSEITVIVIDYLAVGPA